jgi:hypothetical protein
MDEIARKVVARIQSGSGAESMATGAAKVSRPVRLVTVSTVTQVAASAEPVLLIDGRSVITPSARDEAKRMGVVFRCADAANTASQTKPTYAELSSTAQASPQTLSILDSTERNWIDGMVAALNRRGIAASRGESIPLIVITDRPGVTTYEYCRQGRRAVSIGDLADVDRFAGELSPEIWVIDTQRVNLPLAINIAARAARHAPAIVPQGVTE